MTDYLELLPPSGRVRPRAFIAAAIGAPLLIAAVGAPVVVPPFAAILGFPAFLALGLPVFWLTLRNCPDTAISRPFLTFAAAGFLANLGTYPLYFVYFLLDGARPSSARCSASPSASSSRRCTAWPSA